MSRCLCSCGHGGPALPGRKVCEACLPSGWRHNRSSTQLRRLRWYDLLTLDHTVCRPCHSPANGLDGKAVRMVTDPEITRLRANARTRKAWYVAARRALKAHIAVEHPELVDRVIWNGLTPSSSR